MGYMDAFLLLDDFFSDMGISRWVYIPAFWMLMLVVFLLTAQLPAFGKFFFFFFMRNFVTFSIYLFYLFIFLSFIFC